MADTTETPEEVPVVGDGGDDGGLSEPPSVPPPTPPTTTTEEPDDSSTAPDGPPPGPPPGPPKPTGPPPAHAPPIPSNPPPAVTEGKKVPPPRPTPPPSRPPPVKAPEVKNPEVTDPTPTSAQTPTPAPTPTTPAPAPAPTPASRGGGGGLASLTNEQQLEIMSLVKGGMSMDDALKHADALASGAPVPIITSSTTSPVDNSPKAPSVRQVLKSAPRAAAPVAPKKAAPVKAPPKKAPPKLKPEDTTAPTPKKVETTPKKVVVEAAPKVDVADRKVNKFFESSSEEDSDDDEGTTDAPTRSMMSPGMSPRESVYMPEAESPLPPSTPTPTPAPVPVETPPPPTSAPRTPQQNSAPPPRVSSLSEGLQMPHNAMDTSEMDILLVEGYLTKNKTSKFKSKQRHFRLTERSFAYYESNAAKLLSAVSKASIVHVEDMVGSTKMKIKTTQDFGGAEEKGKKQEDESGKTEMLLTAPTARAKAKWLNAFMLDLNRPTVGYERLVCEGYLVKVQPACTLSTTRWFAATNKSFSYYKDEGGDLYAKVPWENILYVTHTDNKNEFKLQANVPMTKTGFYDTTCRAANKQLRDKWVAMMQRILPQGKMSTELQMSCYMEEKVDLG